MDSFCEATALVNVATSGYFLDAAAVAFVASFAAVAALVAAFVDAVGWVPKMVSHVADRYVAWWTKPAFAVVKPANGSSEATFGSSRWLGLTWACAEKDEEMTKKSSIADWTTSAAAVVGPWG